MTELSFVDNTFKLVGDGPVRIPGGLLTPIVLGALIAEPADSDFFVPCLCDLLDAASLGALRTAFQNVADPEIAQRYKSMELHFGGLQPSRKWSLADLVVVWRTKLGFPMIEEILRTKDHRTFIIQAGSNDILSEQELYMSTLKTVEEHLDGHVADTATVVKYTKAIIKAPVVERRICVSTPEGVATVSAWGPACLDCSQWELPVGHSYISQES
jgi:hypothetical protein